MKLRWLESSLDDRVAILEWIGEDRPRAAVDIDHRLVEAALLLETFPEMGREGRAENTRELAVAGTPYLLIYTVGYGIVSIIRVLHGARQWPPDA